MKKLIFFIGLVIAMALVTINLPLVKQAHAEQARVDVFDQQKQLIKSVVFAVGVNEYYVNGKTPGARMDARPFIKDGRTFVPVRFLGNALGVTDHNISWDNSQKKAALKLGQNTVEMVVGVPGITANGQAKDIDVAPILNETEGRTYLPARYIAEGLGFEVGWDPATETVLCWPRGEAKPDVSAVKQYVENIKKPVSPQNPPMPPNLLPTDKTEGKPEEVKQLEGLLGVTTGFYNPSWNYLPVWEKTTWDEAMWKLANQNNSRSYFTLNYDPEVPGMIVAIKWIRNLSDIRGVELDLSPMEKVLNWRFPNNPDKVQEMMACAWQVAERTKSSRSDRAPWKYYYIDSWKVSIGSVGGCFVEAIIGKNQ
ncbi:MAG: copper amine oxidase N-terminal domain-containing protein [Bacillota bacterium]